MLASIRTRYGFQYFDFVRMRYLDHGTVPPLDPPSHADAPAW
jgi:hypothetical protein